MPKLFIASGIFHPEAGGPATYLYEITPHLQTLGWDVRLMAYGDASPTAYPYPVTRIPRRTLPLRLGHYAWSARPLLEWADLVYLHTIDLPLWGSRRAPRVMKVVGDQAWERCIRKGWIPATTDVDAFQTADLGRRVASQRAMRSQQVGAMDGVIVPSAYLKRMVVGWGVPEERVHVVYNALPPAESLPRMSQVEARERLRLDAGPLLLTAARLTPWKGVDHLIGALRAVPDVRLLVAGDGPELPRLKALARDLGDRATFLGRVSREQMPLYMQAADYLVLYSGYEGLSHTLLESLRLGTPVIASDKGGNPETVRHGVNGYLVPYVDVAALTDTLRDAFRPGQREILAANHDIDLARFDFTTMVQQTHAALASYINP